MIEILQNFGLGVLGLAIYVLWSVREYLREFDLHKLVRENKAFWYWSMAMLLASSTLLVVAPDSASAIKTMTGLDLFSETMSYVSLGIALGGISSSIPKKKLTDKK